MTTIKEVLVSSIGEPAQVRVERGQKGGYGFEVNYHGETMEDALMVVLGAIKRLEKELYGIPEKEQSKGEQA